MERALFAIMLAATGTAQAGWEVSTVTGGSGYSAWTYNGNIKFAVHFYPGQCSQPLARFVGRNGGWHSGAIFVLRVDEGVLWRVEPAIETTANALLMLNASLPPETLAEILRGRLLRIKHGQGIERFDLTGSREALTQAARSCIAEDEDRTYFPQEPAPVEPAAADGADAKYFDM